MTVSSKLLKALEYIRDASWVYYDGYHVWCRYCWSTRPSPDRDADLSWHEPHCIYRVVREEERTD